MNNVQLVYIDRWGEQSSVSYNAVGRTVKDCLVFGVLDEKATSPKWVEGYVDLSKLTLTEEDWATVLRELLTPLEKEFITRGKKPHRQLRVSTGLFTIVADVRKENEFLTVNDKVVFKASYPKNVDMASGEGIVDYETLTDIKTFWGAKKEVQEEQPVVYQANEMASGEVVETTQTPVLDFAIPSPPVEEKVETVNVSEQTKEVTPSIAVDLTLAVPSALKVEDKNEHTVQEESQVNSEEPKGEGVEDTVHEYVADGNSDSEEKHSATVVILENPSREDTEEIGEVAKTLDDLVTTMRKEYSIPEVLVIQPKEDESHSTNQLTEETPTNGANLKGTQAEKLTEQVQTAVKEVVTEEKEPHTTLPSEEGSNLKNTDYPAVSTAPLKEVFKETNTKVQQNATDKKANCLVEILEVEYQTVSLHMVDRYGAIFLTTEGPKKVSVEPKEGLGSTMLDNFEHMIRNLWATELELALKENRLPHLENIVKVLDSL